MLEVYNKLGEDMKQCFEKDRLDRFDKDCCRHSDFSDCHEHPEEGGFGEWIPILIIVFLLLGGTNIFGGGHDDCWDNNNGFGGSWLLILLVIFLFLGNQREGKGFLGGIFG